MFAPVAHGGSDKKINSVTRDVSGVNKIVRFYVFDLKGGRLIPVY
jgi:hypothetical protein